MSVRTRDWLKFGALVAIAFVFGLAFASAVNFPKQTGATETAPALQAPARVPIPAAKPVATVAVAKISQRPSAELLVGVLMCSAEPIP